MYSDRYWEMFNEIGSDFDNVAIRTFKVGLPAEHGLRKSLTRKLATSVRQLMDRIDKYKQTLKLRLSLRRRGISSQTATIITDPKGILLGNLGLRLLR